MSENQAEEPHLLLPSSFPLFLFGYLRYSQIMPKAVRIVPFQLFLHFFWPQPFPLQKCCELCRDLVNELWNNGFNENPEEFYLEMVDINKTHEDNTSHRFPDNRFVCSAKNCGAIFNKSCHRNRHEKRCHTESDIVPKTKGISQKVHRVSSLQGTNFYCWLHVHFCKMWQELQERKHWVFSYYF